MEFWGKDFRLGLAIVFFLNAVLALAVVLPISLTVREEAMFLFWFAIGWFLFSGSLGGLFVFLQIKFNKREEKRREGGELNKFGNRVFSYNYFENQITVYYNSLLSVLSVFVNDTMLFQSGDYVMYKKTIEIPVSFNDENGIPNKKDLTLICTTLGSFRLYDGDELLIRYRPKIGLWT